MRLNVKGSIPNGVAVHGWDIVCACLHHTVQTLSQQHNQQHILNIIFNNVMSSLLSNKHDWIMHSSNITSCHATRYILVCSDAKTTQRPFWEWMLWFRVGLRRLFFSKFFRRLVCRSPTHAATLRWCGSSTQCSHACAYGCLQPFCPHSWRARAAFKLISEKRCVYCLFCSLLLLYTANYIGYFYTKS